MQCNGADIEGLRIHTVSEAVLHSAILLCIAFIFVAVCHSKERAWIESAL
jgi:hypothetical protein